MALLKSKYISLFQKKVKASSLVETLVATVIIVLIFAIASLTLNNVFLSSIKNNTDEINRELNKLQYQLSNEKIKVPYNDTFKDWEITIEKTTESTINFITFEATHKNYKKTVTKKLIDASK
ncbi:type IV pilus modification PilV family protein [Urechidicola croceus]|uniref:Type II secretion system protein n=1 Tax=Urechidicola croceus TaxID=1850246 RepID=A0A1D8P8C0_9FLAO|nr:hypothetical protein [Urechidicola croceus]AOW20781.1 hypothetical protein LPB138_08870 [Urechidicola croceus]